MDKILRNELIEVFPWVNSKMDIHNLDDIFQTVKAAPGPYGDMTPRHLKGIGRPEVAEKKDAIFIKIAKAIKNCLESHYSTQEEYDAWHKETCISLASELESICSKGVIVKPGKAQKLINMSMKHIFCFDNAEEVSLNGAFQFCHMPIDKYVLSWYYREVHGLGFLNDDDVRLNWGKHDYEDYIKIQQSIRSFLSDKTRNQDYLDNNGNTLTPFEAEFYIWNEEKLIRAAHFFTKELSYEHSRRWMKSGTLKKQLTSIQQIINNN